ncbi:MAG: hypothetical protein K6G23_06900, partial [Lachnospiraceae bacterium]|nr:hypothetical protein [Lachnospiraceae bacterium]
MFKITTITCEDQIIYENGTGHVVVTDAQQPRFGYAVESSLCGSRIREATLEIYEGAAPRCIWSYHGDGQIDLQYHGEALNAYTQYTVVLRVTDEYEESDTACCTFETGRLTDPW